MPLNARLHITTKWQNGITHMGSCYYSPPFRLANIREDRQQALLPLMIMSSSPGILDGDDYNMTIDVADGCSLQLHTQSYQRLFAMLAGARQTMNVQIGETATFLYLPHPSVPHAGSCFKGINNIVLSPSATLVWGEILTCGRSLNSEQFAFNRYQTITTVYVGGKCAIRENLLVQPSLFATHQMGQWEGYTHMAGFVFLCWHVDARRAADVVHEYLQTKDNLLFGVSKAPCNGITVRIMAYGAELLFSTLQQLCQRLLQLRDET